MNGEKEIAPCEFCGNLTVYGASTPYHGYYCQSCIRTARDYEIEALKEIREERKLDKAKSIAQGVKNE